MQENIPGKGKAVASMVLGIIGVVMWFFGWFVSWFMILFALFSIIFGIIGLILAGSAKKAGCMEGVQKAGTVLSLLSMLGGTIVLVACTACVGLLVGTGALDLT